MYNMIKQKRNINKGGDGVNYSQELKDRTDATDTEDVHDCQ